MTAWHVIDPSRFRDLLCTLHGLTWGWTTAETDALAARLGWQIVETVDGKGAVADAGWDIGDDEIELAFTGDRVDDITIRLTDTAPRRQPGATQFLDGAYSDLLDIATRVLGPTSARTAGSRPEVRWRGADTTVLLKHVGAAVTLVWADNAFQDRWDRLQEVS